MTTSPWIALLEDFVWDKALISLSLKDVVAPRGWRSWEIIESQGAGILASRRLEGYVLDASREVSISIIPRCDNPSSSAVFFAETLISQGVRKDCEFCNRTP